MNDAVAAWLRTARIHLWDYSTLLERDGRARQAETIRQLIDRMPDLPPHDEPDDDQAE